MRLIKSTFSFLSLQNSWRHLATIGALCVAIGLTGCSKSSDQTAGSQDATGKGNGGNQLMMSRQKIDLILAQLKPRLKIAFEGLRLLALIEQRVPGTTDLSDNPALLRNLLVMFGGTAPAIQDLETEDNIKPQDEPCIDFRGVKNAASAVALEVGGKLCLSISEIQRSAVKNFDQAGEILVLALATHEFVHHFVVGQNLEETEKIAREVQQFLEQQLIRQVRITGSSIVSADEASYLIRFREYAKTLSDSAMPGERR